MDLGVVGNRRVVGDGKMILAAVDISVPDKGLRVEVIAETFDVRSQHPVRCDDLPVVSRKLRGPTAMSAIVVGYHGRAVPSSGSADGHGGDRNAGSAPARSGARQSGRPGRPPDDGPR